MNRKQRRATLKHGPPDARAAEPAGSQINKMFLDALALESAGKLDDAARGYKRVVGLNPDHAEAHNNLARVFHAQGKAKDASVFYAHALALMPQLFQQYSGIRGTLTSLLPQRRCCWCCSLRRVDVPVPPKRPPRPRSPKRRPPKRTSTATGSRTRPRSTTNGFPSTQGPARLRRVRHR